MVMGIGHEQQFWKYLILTIFLIDITYVAGYSKGKINSIIQFGDSLADTGNYRREKPLSSFCSRPPYGVTAFAGRPTGRCSDGFLIVDFLAKALNLPLLNPYLDSRADFSHGVNFAVVGATALNTSVLAAMNITSPYTNSSLSVQLGWFQNYISSSFHTRYERESELRKALLLMGEIGGNDFNYALLQGKTLQESYRDLVPKVIGVIKDAVKEVVDKGANRVIVPGNFPIGCLPVFLASVRSSDPAIFDDLKCVRAMNELAQFYNTQLQVAIKDLQQQYPRAVIIYGDYYTAFTWILKNAVSLGFEKDGVFKACCGTGNNPYNFNITQFCGVAVTTPCPDPKKRIHWDGIHLSHKANEYLAKHLMSSIFPKGQTCPSNYSNSCLSDGGDGRNNSV